MVKATDLQMAVISMIEATDTRIFANKKRNKRRPNIVHQMPV